MRVVPFVLFLSAIACGGKTTSAPIPVADLPATGTVACDPAEGTCTLCNDELWHCGGRGPDAGGIPACPSGDSTCPTGTSCVICPEDGTGSGSWCNGVLNPGGDNNVETIGPQPVTCTQ